MARLLWLSCAAAGLLSVVRADVSFTSPSAGATLTGGGTIDVEWKDSGDSPSISDLTTYQLFLCAGGNDAASQVQLVAIQSQGTFSVTGNKAQGAVGVNVGADTKNAYFMKIVSTASTGGTVTNYSPRFSLSGMTGTFPDTVVTGLKSVTGTDGPDTVNNVADSANAGTSAGGDFGQAYSLQTGATRYAPMQPIPPKKITKTNTKPQYPTSAFTVASKYLATPFAQTTITQSQTFSVSSMENTVAAAPMPSDDMAKFLARWKD